MDLDEFSDDGLDEFGDTVFQELENNAIQLTQAAHQLPKQQQDTQNQPQAHNDYRWEEDDDLDTTEVINHGGGPVGRPAVTQTFQQQTESQQADQVLPQHRPQTRHHIPPVPNPRWNPTINATARSIGGLASRPQIGGASTSHKSVYASQASVAARPQPSQFAQPPLSPSRFAPSQSSQAPQGDVFSALQQRLRALESELNAARGEASILRANSAKSQQQHDAEVARLKKLNSEHVEKQERIVEAAVAAERNASTELQFLQRDFKEVNDRARRKDATTGGGQGAGLGVTTPRKTKQWGFADGFDDMDIVVSPSKGQARARNAGSVAANVGERTPSKGKRKRPVFDSPVGALETHTDDLVMHEDEAVQPSAQSHNVVAVTAPPFEFLQLVLDHGHFHQQPPTFDVLSRFALPSDPSTSFASIIFQTLPLMGFPHRPMQLLVDFVEMTLRLWASCCEEGYWQPVQYLVALISFTYDLHTTSVAPLNVLRLVPVAQDTIIVLAAARYRLPDGNLANYDDYKVLEQNVDTTQILSLLYIAALSCVTTRVEGDSGPESKAVDFWKLVTLDFILLLLTPKQRFEDVVGVLFLLSTSSLPESIGPIIENQDRDAAFVSRAVIERVSAKLIEHSRPASTADQKRTMQLAALRALIAFARHPFGAEQLASHDNALPRLVTCLSASIDSLYDQFISPSVLSLPKDGPVSDSLHTSEIDPTASLNRIISQCVLLIHVLVTSPSTSNVADISQKLSLSHGGSQRYMIALGRLTFAEEDLVLEAGIESEVVEAAHELLELAVTPDEGEIVSEAFGA